MTPFFIDISITFSWAVSVITCSLCDDQLTTERWPGPGPRSQVRGDSWSPGVWSCLGTRPHDSWLLTSSSSSQHQQWRCHSRALLIRRLHRAPPVFINPKLIVTFNLCLMATTCGWMQNNPIQNFLKWWVCCATYTYNSLSIKQSLTSVCFFCLETCPDFWVILMDIFHR